MNLQVWGRAAIATQISSPKFNLIVDGINVGQVTPDSATFQPNTSVKYSLKFVTTDGQTASTLSSHASSQVTVGLDTISSAALYSASNQASTTRSFDFPPAMVQLRGTVTFQDSSFFFNASCCYLVFNDGAQTTTANISRTDYYTGIVNQYTVSLPNSLSYTISVWRSGAGKICDAGTLNLQATVNLIGYDLSC